MGITTPIEIARYPDAAYIVAIAPPGTILDGLRRLGLWLAAMVGAFFVVIVTLSYRVVRSIQDPLGSLQIAATRFADGDLAYRCQVPEPSELGRLADTMNSMAEQLTTRIEAIRAQQTQLESILSSMIEGVVLLDDRFRVQTMNDAAIRLFEVESLTSAPGEKRTLLEVIRNSEIYEMVLKTFATGLNQEGTITVYTNPPSHMQLHSGIVDLSEGKAVLLVFNDVTRMQELENIRRDFVANVSHELKTPITSILGFVETLMEDDVLENRDESKRFLGIVSDQAQRLNAIIEDLLQLSRLEQHREGVDEAPFRIEELIANVKQSLQQKADEKQIVLADEYVGNPRTVANFNLLEQALSNLVDNAIKYCPPGSRVDILVRRSAQKLAITVADDGPGIPIESQSRVFERFYRVDRARSRAQGGTGLGLAIVKHIAQAHDGTVSVESDPGHGSAFTIEIPQPAHGRAVNR
jgi:two-component system phosphate regulon sensor histidine kinase PhoR